MSISFKEFLKEKIERELLENLDKSKDDPCWDGYVQLGTKKKNGQEVPNCVPADHVKEEHLEESQAEYQGRKVTLNKPFRTPDGPKKFGVYVKNDKGNVIIVRFGDPDMGIRRDDDKARKSFRARHDCENANDKTTARYWSCRQWRSGSKVEA